MRKSHSLTLVASLLLSSSLYAESIKKAFEESKIKGEIKTVYSNSNFLGNTKADDIFSWGGNLGAITGDYYGFKLAATFQASSILSDDNNNNVFANDLDVSGAVLSEAYLEYTNSNTSFKAGRQYIYTPLLSTAIDGKSSESVIKDSFEAYTLTNTDIPSTTLIASYVDKYQAKTDGAGDIGEFEDFQDGAYTIYAKNNSIKNLTLQAQYLNENAKTSNTDRSAFYLQADYAIAGHKISAQYLSSKDKTAAANAQDGTLFGLKAMGPLGIGKLGYLLAYNSSTDDNAAVYLGAGAGTSDTPFTALPVNGGAVPVRPDTNTLVGAVIIPAFRVNFIPYMGKSSSDSHVLGDVDAMGAMAIYPVNKNLMLKFNYEKVEIENIITEDTDVTRVYLSYKF